MKLHTAMPSNDETTKVLNQWQNCCKRKSSCINSKYNIVQENSCFRDLRVKSGYEWFNVFQIKHISINNWEAASAEEQVLCVTCQW